jgi:superfamily II DNA helicase RecQ
MRCNIFSVPLEPEAALDRERKLNDFLESSNVKRVFASLANPPEGPAWSILFFCEDGAETTQKTPASRGVTVDSTTPLTGEQARSVAALKKWRADQAAQEGVPLYMVAHNKWLEEIVRMPVKTLDDLARVSGLGEWRVRKYGAKILEVVNTARSAWPASSSSAGHA